MIFAAYKKDKIIHNSLGEEITTLTTRTVIEAESYKEAQKKAYSYNLDYVCNTRLNNIADKHLVFDANNSNISKYNVIQGNTYDRF